MGQLLPRVPSPRTVWGVQEEWVWTGNAQDDVGQLPSNEEHADFVRQEQAWVLLKSNVCACLCSNTSKLHVILKNA